MRSADPLSIAASALPHPVLVSPVWGVATYDRPSLTPDCSRDLPPPHDGRTLLRLHCTLLL